MFFKTWQKYLLSSFLKSFFLMLFCFYGLYFLIDYASRSGANHFHGQLKWNEVWFYYLLEFVGRLDVLVPFAFLMASVRTFLYMNTQNELVALFAGGVSAKAVLRPLIAVAFLCVGLLYLNGEYGLPLALEKMRHIQGAHALKKMQKKRKNFVQAIPLKDRSLLLFRTFDQSQELFSDVYWIKSFDEIYHMKKLQSSSNVLQGFYVDRFIRRGSQGLEKEASFERLAFPEIQFNRKEFYDTAIPPEELSLSKLWSQLPIRGIPNSEKEAELITAFYQKMLMPWISVFVIVGIAASCMRFSRHFPQFFIYSFSIFSLVGFYIIVDAAVVLGSRQVISPMLAVGFPFGCFFSVAFLRFVRL